MPDAARALSFGCVAMGLIRAENKVCDGGAGLSADVTYREIKEQGGVLFGKVRTLLVPDVSA